MWYPGNTELYSSLSCSAFSGSHFTLNCSGTFSRPMSRKTFPRTLNTNVDSPKGKDSVVDFFSRQYFRMVSRSIDECFTFREAVTISKKYAVFIDFFMAFDGRHFRGSICR